MTIRMIRAIAPAILAAVTLTAAPADLSSLQKEFESIAASGDGRVGAAATLLETHEHVAVRGDERFPMQSVFKLPVALAALRLVDAGTLSLAQQVTIAKADLLNGGLHPIAEEFPNGGTFSVETLLRRMVANSDNTAVEAILKVIGGPPAVTARLRELGITGVRVDRGEREMGRDLSAPGGLERYAGDPRDTATPNAAVDLMIETLKGGGLSHINSNRLRPWLTDTETGPARIKGQLPRGTPVAHKTGTGPDINGVNPATNDIGVILLPDGRHLAIAVFVATSRQPLEAREAIIARLAKAAYDYCAQKQ
jgi:beta-lactamase class A